MKLRQPLERDRLIVLKKRVFREADLIVYGLNTQGAKVSYIAPSALKSRKRFGGGVFEPSHFIEVVVQKKSQSSSSSLMRLQEAQIIKDFSGLRRDYDVLQVALGFLAVVDRVGQEGDVHGEDLFNLLGHSLQYLAQNAIPSLSGFRLHFLLKFLAQQGVLPLEEWMRPYLSCSMRDHAALATLEKWGIADGGRSMSEPLESHQALLLERLMEVERSLQEYSATPTRS